jgi:hypothetical protein
MVQFGSTPPIGGLIRLSIPVKQLRHLIAQVTHATFPSCATLNKGNIGIDITPASPASGDYRIIDHGNRLITLLERSVRSKDQRKWDFGLVQQGSGGWDCIDR